MASDSPPTPGHVPGHVPRDDPGTGDGPGPSLDVEVNLLGPLEVRAGGQPVTVGGTRQRIVLATLLLDPGRVIATERLTTAVWDDDPPTTARTQVQISISKLRGVFAAIGLPDAIVTHESGYLIQVPDGAVDIGRFRRMVAAGRQAAQRRDTATAVVALREALDLWRGEAFAGLRSRLLESVALRLEEERLAVVQERIDLELAAGRHHEVIGEMRGLVTSHPLREKLYQQLMLALYRDGRQAEALEVYRDARRILVEEHGLDPGDELRTLEQAILAADPAVAAAAPAGPPVRGGADQGDHAAPDGRVIPPLRESPGLPRQLPARPHAFVGRDDLRSQMRQALAARTGTVLVVSGPAGVGKTAMAVTVAYDALDLFPDGQLFAHLRSGDTRPVSSGQVLDQFLRALGVPPATLPRDREALAGLYRSHLAGRQALVLLDDAATTAQVEPLLPAYPGVAVIVTTRGSLAGLSDVQRFEIGPLAPGASHELLCQIVGRDRVAAEPEAAAAVAESCSHLPLALRIAAGKLSARRHWQIARMAHRLGDESRQLDELSLDGAGVRASLSISVEALDTAARELLPLLGTLGAASFASWVAGPLLDVDAYAGADALDELVDAQLVEVVAGTGAQARYRLHDLVAVFARELLAAEVPAKRRTAAQHRLLRCWLHLTGEAHRRAYGGDFTVSRSAVDVWPLPKEVTDELLADPINWFESEHANLVAAVRLAAELDAVDLCSDLSVTAVTFFEARSHREDWRETHELALELAVRHGDERAMAVVRCSRAGLALVEQRFTEAAADLSAALAWFERDGDAHGRGLALRGLGSIDRLQGRYRQARQRYEAALADLRASGDRIGEAHVLINLAQVCSEQEDRRTAETLLREALTISGDLGVRRVVAQARFRLGRLHLDRGEPEAAEIEFTAALRDVGVADDPAGRAYALLGLGGSWLARGQISRAGEALDEALTTMRRVGSRVGEGQVLLALAELAQRTGADEVAGQRLAEADAAFDGIGAAAWQERVRQLRGRLPAESPGAAPEGDG
jgi:DNA-binding SARP family transcriptional activator/tetratricopeptide (TPR) repeat protein